MPKDDLVYVSQMLDLAASVVAKVSGKTRSEFDADENLQLAVTHLIQTLGEAARRVSESYRVAHPQVPWHYIVGMRHKIVHDYMEIDFDIVWDVAATELPTLLPTLAGVAHDRSDPHPE